MHQKESNEWHFDFGLCVTRSDQSIPESKCDELFDIISERAKRRHLGIDGGVGEFKESETNQSKHIESSINLAQPECKNGLRVIVSR